MMETMLEKIERLESELYGLQLRAEQLDTKNANLTKKIEELALNNKTTIETPACTKNLSSDDVLEIIKKTVNLAFVNKLYRK